MKSLSKFLMFLRILTRECLNFFDSDLGQNMQIGLSESKKRENEDAGKEF